MTFVKPLRNGEKGTLRREREKGAGKGSQMPGWGQQAWGRKGRGRGPGARGAHGAGSTWGVRAGHGTQDGEHFEKEQVVSSVDALRIVFLWVFWFSN